MATAVFSRPAPVAYENPKYGFAGPRLIEKINPNALGWLEPVSVNDPDEALRERYERDGVLFVKGAISREKVLAMRKKYFEYGASSGVLKLGTDPTDGIFYEGDPHKSGEAGPGVASHLGLTEAECDFLAKSVSAQKEEWVHPFAQDGLERPLLFKRQLLQSNIPNLEGTATKVHFDQIFLRAALPTSLTSWVPIGDISPESGGLIYLENSVPIDLEIEEEFTKRNAELPDEERVSAFNTNMMDRGNLSRDAGKFAHQEGSGRRWLIADYKSGDVVFHHPCMIHASGVNRDPDGRTRLATDLRFADRATPDDYRRANG
ncbi:hypothetical protein GQ53DRAFT_791984 [Thozetella sp. PMI_491]|nr:hypothetical protein GQ53DRAFT_791984 [Thozetella sp. PMI_491]